jgi:toxin ParE1/3/4
MAQIIWSEPALADLAAIADYIALDKPEAAKRLVCAVVARIEHLGVFPLAGGKPRALAGTPYRQVVVPPVKVFYRLTEQTVLVIYVMRGEQRFRLGDVSGRDR